MKPKNKNKMSNEIANKSTIENIKKSKVEPGKNNNIHRRLINR